MEPRTNLKSIGKTTISIVIVERVEGMGIYGWRLEERFARGWRQRSEDSRLRLMASDFVNTSARQVGAPRKAEDRRQQAGWVIRELGN